MSSSSRPAQHLTHFRVVSAVLVPMALLAGLAAVRIPAEAAGTPGTPAVVQGEAFALTRGAGQVLADPQAAAGKALLIWSKGTASASITTAGAATELTLVVRGDQCAGAPSMTVAVDGHQVVTRPVPQSSWTALTTTGRWATGRHSVSVAFTNDALARGCDRNLWLDEVRLGTPAPVPTVTAAPTSTAPAGNPLAGTRLWVDPASPARSEIPRQAANPAAVAALTKIADQPRADWFGDWVPTARIQADVARRTEPAAREGSVPVLVAYAIPGRDCGGYSAGGMAGPSEYGAWIRAFAAGLGTRKAIVVVEPDALAHLECLGTTKRAERVAMLRDALAVLKGATGASVYLDAGNSGWRPAAVMAARLREVGVASARGFSLNVANFNRTTSEVAYGDKISKALGGAHYVVDTGRSGLGPAAGKAAWCNPQGRALGERPTTATSSAAADAYLWVKTVGNSDGECGRGEPKAGTWWPAYAIGLGTRAAW